MEKHEKTTKPNPVREKAYKFSVRIVILVRKLKAEKAESALVNQLLRSGTSITANIEEANASISKAEFSSKISVAFKEARETQFWLSLLADAKSLSKEEFIDLNEEITSILKILWAILKTTRIKGNGG